MASDCRLTLKRSELAPDFSTSIGRVPLTTGATQLYSTCGPENGCGVDQCLKQQGTGQANNDGDFNDYLQVFAAFGRTRSNLNDPETFTFGAVFCGLGLGRDQAVTNQQNSVDGKDDGSGIVTDGPFIVTFKADNNPGQLAPATGGGTPSGNKNELGFSVQYEISTSCPDLTLVD